MHITLTSLLDALDLVKGQQAVGKGVLGARGRRRADDRTAGGRQRRGGREAVVIGADEASVQWHQRTGLDDNGWLGGCGAGRVGRSWSSLSRGGRHVHGSPKGIGGGHLVHVHDRQAMVLLLLMVVVHVVRHVGVLSLVVVVRLSHGVG